MFSGALAGALRVGAVLLTAGGMAGGVYFIVQVGESNDAAQLQAQATETAIAGDQLSPPNQIDGPPAETPTPLGPIPTPPAIDTSDWLTYESPLGFTIKYPPGWLVDEQAPPSLSPEEEQRVNSGAIPPPPSGGAKIINERAQEVRALRDPGDSGEGFAGGEALIEILPDPIPIPRFDANALFQLCGGVNDQRTDSSSRVSEVTIGGRPAVLCQQEGPSAFDEHWVTGETYWVGLPSGRIVHIAAIAADGDTETLQILRTILSTVSFEGTP